MRMNRENKSKTRFVFSLVLLLSCIFFVAGCGSRLQSRVSSELPNSEVKSVQLEEAPIETPTEILVPPSVAKEKEAITAQVVEPNPSETSTQMSFEDAELGPNGDVFASSGQASPPISVTIPHSTPVPALAKPSNLQNLPFTLSDIFFDYDQYTIHERDIKTLETNAQVLLGRYSKKRILIQGHCDERGTEEYNLALGIRRAQAVKDYLVDLGVPPEKLQVLSYGKEKPFCTQHNQNCWKHNRRSHLVFQ
ncbi:MAG: peptidoglycan-associated lipoprotein Pal [Nitrospirales bacterium]